MEPPVIVVHARTLCDSLAHDKQLVVRSAVAGREHEIAAEHRLQLAKLLDKLRWDVNVAALVRLRHEVVLGILVDAYHTPG